MYGNVYWIGVVIEGPCDNRVRRDLEGDKFVLFRKLLENHPVGNNNFIRPDIANWNGNAVLLAVQLYSWVCFPAEAIKHNSMDYSVMNNM